MEKVIYVDDMNCEHYEKFIDYAFKTSDYFMLVYVRYNMSPFNKITKEIKKNLAPLKVKKRNDPYWPGTPGTYTPNTEYQVILYRCDESAKKELLKVNEMFDWKCPGMPEDLSFFRKNVCWFYSVGHERLASLINPNLEDIKFLKSINLYDDLKVKFVNGWYYEEKL